MIEDRSSVRSGAQSYYRTLRRRGAHREARALLKRTLAEHHGSYSRAAHLFELHPTVLLRQARAYGLDKFAEELRKRRRAPAPWLMRTLSVLEGGIVDTIQKLYEAAAGMTVEEIAAEIEASARAGQVDATALAEALAAGAGAMAPEG